MIPERDNYRLLDNFEKFNLLKVQMRYPCPLSLQNRRRKKINLYWYDLWKWTTVVCFPFLLLYFCIFSLKQTSFYSHSPGMFFIISFHYFCCSFSNFVCFFQHFFHQVGDLIETHFCKEFYYHQHTKRNTKIYNLMESFTSSSPFYIRFNPYYF